MNWERLVGWFLGAALVLITISFLGTMMINGKAGDYEFALAVSLIGAFIFSAASSIR